MDLRTIKNKIKCHDYNNLDEFLLDMLLICDNCLQYHKRHSKIGKAGASLKKYFEKRCANLGLRDLSLCSPVVNIGADNSNQNTRRVSTRNKKWSTQIFTAFYMNSYCKNKKTECSFSYVHTAVLLFGFSCFWAPLFLVFPLSTTCAEFVYCRPLVWTMIYSILHTSPFCCEEGSCFVVVFFFFFFFFFYFY